MRWVLVLLVGCGRIAFDPRSDAQPAGSDGDGGGGGMDAAPQTRTWGERPGLDFRNVTADTFISNEAGEGALNYGGAVELRSEQDVSEVILVRFDLSALATSAQVISAKLTVQITQLGTGSTVAVRPILERWDEGTADGTAGTANFFQRGPGDWATAGGDVPASAGPPMGSGAPAMLGDFTIALDRDAVAAWIADPATNSGMRLSNSSGESTRIASSEHGAVDIRPMLTVTYVP